MAPVHARADGPSPVPKSSRPSETGGERSRDAAAVERANAAWTKGQWSTVRQILEPIASDPGRMRDPLLRERVLTMLADATLSDETIQTSVRRQLASEYLIRLVEQDPDFRLPSGIYSPALVALHEELLATRVQREAGQCVSDRNACQADLSQAGNRYVDLQRKHETLRRQFAHQEVEVREKVARNRAIALIPFGVGHLYNGNLGLGLGFLFTEAAVGAAGLGLILRRTLVDECRRTNGFARESLRCATDDTHVVDRRKAEEAIGWVFIGTLVLDVIWAQIAFRPTQTVSVRRMRREQLEAPAPAGERPRSRRERPRARVRPVSAPVRGGAGLGVHLTF